MGRRAAADVEGHVEDRALQHADELALGVGLFLVVRAPKGVRRSGENQVALDEELVEPGRVKIAGAVPLGKVTAGVAETLGLEDLDIGATPSG
jgi:hypothetical protein